MAYVELSKYLIDELLPPISKHIISQSNSIHRKPFVLGLTGLQGSGKSTLASRLVDDFNVRTSYRALQVSLDDFYKTHAERTALRQAYPDNGLLRVRGQPATHDVQLAEWFFDQFSGEKSNSEILIPHFDKSLFEGDGDRVSREEWITVKGKVDVIVFEGWCVGFQPLAAEAVQEKWRAEKEAHESRRETVHVANSSSTEYSITTLHKHSLDDLLFVNSHLKGYCERFMGSKHFDAFIHLDTKDLVNVYTWRMQQEHAMRKLKGTSMTDEAVIRFGTSYPSHSHSNTDVSQFKAICLPTSST